MFAKRGVEGINGIHIEDLELLQDKNGLKFYKLNKRRLTKNNRGANSQNLKYGGQIAFHTNRFGFNFGQYLEDYMKKCSKENPLLFQPPIYHNGTTFNIYSNPDTW